MKKTLIVIILVAIAGGGWYVYSRPKPTLEVVTTSSQNQGTYAYECDEHVQLSMTPSGDMATITVAPIGGAYPPTTTLSSIATSTNNRYEGGGIVFTASGETITLGEGDSAINCSPIPNGNNAPFNWGE